MKDFDPEKQVIKKGGGRRYKKTLEISIIRQISVGKTDFSCFKWISQNSSNQLMISSCPLLLFLLLPSPFLDFITGKESLPIFLFKASYTINLLFLFIWRSGFSSSFIFSLDSSTLRFTNDFDFHCGNLTVLTCKTIMIKMSRQCWRKTDAWKMKKTNTTLLC